MRRFPANIFQDNRLDPIRSLAKQADQPGRAHKQADIEDIKTDRLFQSPRFAEIKQIVEHMRNTLKPLPDNGFKALRYESSKKKAGLLPGFFRSDKN
jgi:hypothetical protein